MAANDLVNFNRQANRYELDLIEREVPTDEEITQRRGGRLVGQLLAEAEESAGKGRTEMDDLAAAILGHEQAKTMVSYLAFQHLAKAPKDASEDEPSETESHRAAGVARGRER